nr:hypothetical protein [Tanacetum cinerariifolium]
MASAVICLATGRKFNFSKYIFDSMVRNVDSPIKFLIAAAPTPPSSTHAPLPPPQDPITTPPQAQPVTPHAIPPQEQPTDTSESSMPLLNTLMETCATLRMHPNRGKIEEIDADEDITLVDMETQVDLGAELQGRKDDDNASSKDVSAAEPTVFDDEEVTMTMAQTLIKMKAKKQDSLMSRWLKGCMMRKLNKLQPEKSRKRMISRKLKGSNNIMMTNKKTLTGMLLLSKYNRSILIIRKYQSLKRKPVSIAQATKNMIIYLKNMVVYKMEHFRGMTYDKESFKKLKAVEVSGSESTHDTPTNDPKEMSKEDVKNMLEIIPVSEFKPDKDVEEPQKKRVAEETLLQESFKKLKAVEVSGSESTHDTPTNDPKEMSKEDVKNMLGIIPVSEFKVEALQVKEDLDALWRLVKHKFSSPGPNFVKEKALWEELKRHDMFMLTEKNYPLSNGVITLMLSAKLQVEEDTDMARDLVIKIFMKANKPKSRSLDTSSK